MEEQQQLESQVALLESRLLCGGKNIIDHTNEQQREIEKKNEELAEQKVTQIIEDQKALVIYSTVRNISYISQAPLPLNYCPANVGS